MLTYITYQLGKIGSILLYQAVKIGAMLVGGIVSLFALAHFATHAFLPIDYAVTQTLSRAWESKSVEEMVRGMGKKLVSKKIEDIGELHGHIERVALENNVPSSAGKAILKIESSDNKNRISHAGALGAMQIMPFNASRCSHLKPNLNEAELREELIDNDVFNIECWGVIYSEDVEATKGNLVLAAKRYNGGPKCLKIKCAESEAYAVKFSKGMKTFQS